MMNAHILLIEKLVIQSLVMFLLNFKTQLTTFLKDTRDVKFTECWWKGVD